MSSVRKLQLDQIRDERREQIKQVALKIFAHRGFTGTKTSMIAMEAGISEGLIYRYFKSKDELFTTLVQELMAERRKEAENVQYLPGSPFEQIKALTENIFDTSSRYAFRYAFMLIYRIRSGEEAPKAVAPIFVENSDTNFFDQLVPIFVRGQQAGEFCEGNPRQLLAWYFYTLTCLIVGGVEQEEYGLPSIEFLMRTLTK